MTENPRFPIEWTPETSDEGARFGIACFSHFFSGRADVFPTRMGQIGRSRIAGRAPNHLDPSMLYYTNSMMYQVVERNMGTIRKTITLTEKQDEWVKAQIENGDYTNDSEYFRDLVRRHQDQGTKLRTLKDAIEEGLSSGVSEKTVGELWADAEARYKTRNG